MGYQYSLRTLKISVYNNLTLLYRHWERVNMILMLTMGMNSILDVGCGFGDLSLELSNEGKDVVMLDVDPRRLRVAKHRIKKFGLGAELVCGDAHQLPF
jgi:ubiquinone/menaquinone biosynthesis C-methylase UbiE